MPNTEVADRLQEYVQAQYQVYSMSLTDMEEPHSGRDGCVKRQRDQCTLDGPQSRPANDLWLQQIVPVAAGSDMGTKLDQGLFSLFDYRNSAYTVEYTCHHNQRNINGHGLAWVIV